MTTVLSFEDYCEHYELDPSSEEAEAQYDGYLQVLEGPE